MFWFIYTANLILFIGQSDEAAPYSEVEVVKKGCIRHVQKRMGARLRELVKKIRKQLKKAEKKLQKKYFQGKVKGMSFMNKEDRQQCWNIRDEYWKCLDDGKSESECQNFRKQYEKFCPSQWVKHFDRKREYLKFKAQIEQDGYVEEHLPKRTPSN